MGWSRNPSNTFLEYKAAGHGAEMFAVENDLQPKILAWLDANLRDAPATRPAVAAGSPTIVEEFWTTLNQPGGLSRARQLYDEAKKRDTGVVLFPETETNLLGYQWLRVGEVKDAIALFHLIAEAYPRSANVYDSLSDAYLAAANKADALKYAQKAIETLDIDTNAPAEFKRFVRESAEGKIKELQPPQQ
jgi:tetratricopeptide (TPR) repeat protein